MIYKLCTQKRKIFVWIASFLAMTTKRIVARNAFSRELAWRNPEDNMKRCMIFAKSPKSMIIKIMRVPYDISVVSRMNCRLSF